MEKKSNPASVALNKLRWAGKTDKQRSDHARMMLRIRWENHKKTSKPKKVLAEV